MANLDDLFRRSQRTVRPATPPAGQWERILEGVNAAPKRSHPGSFVGGVLLGLLLGLGCGTAYHYHLTEPATKVSSVEEVAPAAAPSTETVRVIHDTIRIVENREVKNSTVALWQPGLTSSIVQVQPFTPILQAGGSKARTSTISPFIAALPMVSGVSSRYGAMDVDVLNIRGFRPVGNSGTTVFPSLGWKGFTVFETGEKLVGRWELGVHLTPEYTRGDVGRGIVLNDTKGPFGQEYTFDLDGREVTLYGMEHNLEVPLRAQPRLQLIHLQVARQFSNGLRVGLGVGLRRTAETLPKKSAIDDRLSDGQYLLYNKIQSKEYLGTFNLSYTLWRRQRLQAGIGLVATGYFRRAFNNREYLYSVSTRKYYDVGRGYGNRAPGARFYKWTLLPQLSLHYHLNDRISVGTEIGPGLGLGARYKFY